jgi:hypothetical protein
MIEQPAPSGGAGCGKDPASSHSSDPLLSLSPKASGPGLGPIEDTTPLAALDGR